jgi:hypothetical protein
MNLPDISVVDDDMKYLVADSAVEAPHVIAVETTAEPALMGTTVITEDGFTDYYTQAYIDELKQERNKYKELYETMYRKWSELDTKDLNKKYAEAIAKDYLNKNAELIGNIMTMYDRLKAAMFVRDISYGSEPAEEDVEIITWWQVAKQFKELFNIGDYKDE